MRECPFNGFVNCDKVCGLFVELSQRCAFAVIANELILKRLEHERNLERYELMIQKGMTEL